MTRFCALTRARQSAEASVSASSCAIASSSDSAGGSSAAASAGDGGGPAFSFPFLDFPSWGVMALVGVANQLASGGGVSAPTDARWFSLAFASSVPTAFMFCASGTVGRAGGTGCTLASGFGFAGGPIRCRAGGGTAVLRGGAAGGGARRAGSAGGGRGGAYSIKSQLASNVSIK